MALTCLATTTPPAVGKARSPVVGKPPARGRHCPRVPESPSREMLRPPARPHSPVVREVARYRRERTPKERERSAQAGPVRLSLASSFRPALTCGLRRGRATCPLFSSPFQRFRFSAFSSRLPLNQYCELKADPAGNHGIRQAIPTVPGKTYIIVMDCKARSGVALADSAFDIRHGKGGNPTTWFTAKSVSFTNFG